jgi:S1-C subfamily serine protease
MSKKQAFWIIVAAVLAGWVFNFFIGSFLMARFSTWPLLNRWKILSPQAPIVINNHDTIRVSDSGDTVAAVTDIESKISSIALVNGSSETFVGTAVNLTSDGSFVTAEGSFKNKIPGTYFVILNDGTSAKINSFATDTATSLIFFKAALTSVPVVNLAVSGDMQVGDKVLYVQDSLQRFYARTEPSFISASQKDLEGQVLSSDLPSSSFSTPAEQGVLPGEALINTNGDIVGIWNGSNVISSDLLKQAMALYFNNAQNILRPSFGFSYSIITQTDSRLTGLPEGAKVLEIDSSSAAHTAGLEAGDVITSVGSQPVSENSPLEAILQQQKPGDQVALTITRKSQTMNLNLTVGELK